MAEPYDANKSRERRVEKELRYAARKYFAEKPLPPIPISEKEQRNLQLPSFSDLSFEQVLQGRNGMLANQCSQRNLVLPNFVQHPPPFSNLKQENTMVHNPYAIKKVKSLVKDKVDTKTIARKELVFRDTVRKLQKTSSSDGKEFCYWLFQNSLKLRAISMESRWLKKIVGDDVPVTHLKAALKQSNSEEWKLKQFRNIYGPIDNSAADMTKLLTNFCSGISDEKIKRKFQLLLEFSKKYGKEEAIKAIEEMEAFAVSSLKLPANLPGYQLLEMAKDGRSILNVNPLTNSSQTDWFHFKRFANPVGPSNLIIRHEKLEGLGFVDYQPASGTAVVTGLSTPFIDTLFTFPTKRSKDPSRKLYEKKGTSEVYLRETTWDTLYENIRNDMTLYTCGVEIGLFFMRLKKAHKFTDLAFGNMSDQDFVASLPEFFIVTELPDTKAKILFPTFMKYILPMGDDGMRLGLMMIIEKFWRRIVFLVKVKGGYLRNMDLKWTYWNYFKKGIVIQEWGFWDMGKFVEWGNKMWNKDGKDECVIFEKHSGSIDPFLVYKPGK